MLTERIYKTLEKIGFTHLPQHKSAKLAQGGLDSLMLALLIIELEQEFKIKIPVVPLVKEHYDSINSIEKYLMELGAK